MVAQQTEPELRHAQNASESPLAPFRPRHQRQVAAPGEADAENTARPVVDDRVEELLSSEGEAGSRPSAATAGAEPADSSLDDLLEGFDDDVLAADALADVEAFSQGSLAMPERRARTAATQAQRQEPLAAPGLKPAQRSRAAAPAAAPREMVGETPKEAGRETGRDAGRERPSGARREGGFWRGMALVLVGGVLGAALTLLGLLLSSGTLDYASRGHLDALSRNMGTMQANQEVIWQRLDGIDPLVAEQQRDLAALGEALQQAETDVAAIEQRAAAAEEQVTTLSQEVALLRQTLDSSLDQSEQRMGALEGQTADLNRGLQEVETTLSPLKSAVGRYNSFFDALRNLLVEMQPEK